MSILVIQKKESEFQHEIIQSLYKRFNGCFVMKTDPNYCQGFPDLLILYKNKWAALECKRSENAPRRPNQEYYIKKMDGMSFASFIYPENKEEVLNEMERTLEVER